MSACSSSSSVDRQLQFASLSAAEVEIERMLRSKEMVSTTTFDWAQTLNTTVRKVLSFQ
jgi:hypothetical protein